MADQIVIRVPYQEERRQSSGINPPSRETPGSNSQWHRLAVPKVSVEPHGFIEPPGSLACKRIAKLRFAADCGLTQRSGRWRHINLAQYVASRNGGGELGKFIQVNRWTGAIRSLASRRGREAESDRRVEFR